MSDFTPCKLLWLYEPWHLWHYHLLPAVTVWPLTSMTLPLVTCCDCMTPDISDITPCNLLWLYDPWPGLGSRQIFFRLRLWLRLLTFFSIGCWTFFQAQSTISLCFLSSCRAEEPGNFLAAPAPDFFSKRLRLLDFFQAGRLRLPSPVFSTVLNFLFFSVRWLHSGGWIIYFDYQIK